MPHMRRRHNPDNTNDWVKQPLHIFAGQAHQFLPSRCQADREWPGSGVTKVSPLTAPCPICNVTDTLLPTALMNVTPFSTITLPLVNDPWNSVVLLEFVMSIMPPVKVNPPVTAVRVPVVRLIVPPAG